MDRKIKVWNLKDKCEDFSLTGHRRKIILVFFSKDGEYIVSACEGRTVKVWEFRGRCEKDTIKLKNSIHSVDISKNGELVLIGLNNYEDGPDVKIWNLSERTVSDYYFPGYFVSHASFIQNPK